MSDEVSKFFFPFFFLRFVSDGICLFAWENIRGKKKKFLLNNFYFIRFRFSMMWPIRLVIERICSMESMNSSIRFFYLFFSWLIGRNYFRKLIDPIIPIFFIWKQVTVLPPGEWDPNIRIEPPNIIPSQDKRKQPSQLLLSETPAPKKVLSFSIFLIIFFEISDNLSLSLISIYFRNN